MEVKKHSQLSRAGLFHLSVVYVVWSSTYLAIRVAVNPQTGFPAFGFGFIRLFIASFILLSITIFSKNRLKLSTKELLVLSSTGILLWVGGNGLVTWAERYANSGFAALVVSSTPIWVALINSILSRKFPSWLLIISLVIGFCGLGLLVAPSLFNGNAIDLYSSIALISAAVSWSIGSLIQNRYPLNLPAMVVSTYQHIFGCIGFLVLSIGLGENLTDIHPGKNALIALAYLVTFGSIFAFTSFIKALRLLPINIAMTYAYVNPVLALLLGWLILSEPLTPWALGGCILVVLSVCGIFREKFSAQRAKEV